MPAIILHWSTVEAAKSLLRRGFSLAEAAEKLNVTAHSLDLSLWRNLGAKW